MPYQLTKAELSAALETCKSRKLRMYIRQAIVAIDSLDRKTAMNADLDQFYYREKEAEMLLLEEKLQETLERVLWLVGRMEITFEEVFIRWRHDIRTLSNREDTNRMGKDVLHNDRSGTI